MGSHGFFFVEKIMAVNIGPKIGIEGESKYRSEIQKIITQTKTLKSDMDALESSFDKEASAQDKARAKSELLTKAVQTQKERVQEVAHMYELSKKELGENDEKTLKWKQALNTATIELNKTEQELAETNKVADGYEEAVDDATDANKDFTQSTEGMLAAGKLKDSLNETAEAMQRLAQAGIDAAKELDEGYDTIITKTGATGSALEEMHGIANRIYGTMPVEMSKVGAAVGEVNTRFKQSGDELQKTSQDFLRFSEINSSDVSGSVDSVDRLMKIFSVDVSQTSNVLGLLTKASQDTGISVDTLMGTLDSNGATLRELGFDLESSTAMLAEFEASGVDTSGVMVALRKSVINASKSGKSANDMLADASKRIKNASSDTEALQIATEIFGTKGAIVMAQGLRSGRINLNALSGSLEDYSDVVQNTYEATLDPWDRTQVAIQNVKRAGSELAGNALSTLEPAMEKVASVLDSLTTSFEGLSDGEKKAVGVFTALVAGAAVAGTKVLAVVNTVKELKVAHEVAKGVQALSNATTGAAVAQQGLNVAMLASPVGAVALGVTGLVAAIVALKAGYEHAKQAALEENEELYASVQATREATDAMNTAAETVKTSYDDATDSISQAIAVSSRADELVKTITELNDKTKLTVEEQALLRSSVQELKGLYPELSIEIDESTGKLKQSSAEIRNMVSESERALKIAAYNKIIKESTDALIEATQAKVRADYEAKRVSEGLDKENETRKQQIDDLKERMKSMTDAEREQFQAQLNSLESNKGYTLAAREASETLRAQEDAAKALTEAEEELNGMRETAADSLGITIDEVNEFNAATEESTGAMGDAVDATNAITEATGEAGDQYGETADEIDAYSKEIIDAYNSTAESAQQSVMDQKSLFEELEASEEVSIDSMIAGLQSHIDAYSNWNKNVDSLTSSTRYKTDAGFRAMVNSIASAGIEAAPKLQAITDAFEQGDVRLEEIVSNYGNMDQLSVEYGQKLALATTEAEYGIEAMNAAFVDGGIILEGSAQQMVNSATRPLTSAQLQKAASDEARMAITSMSRTLNSQEPANAVQASLGTVSARNDRLARNTGRGISDSYGRGIKDGRGGIQSGGNDLSATTQQAIQTLGSQKAQAQAAGRDIAQGVSQGIQQGKGQINFAMSSTKTTVTTGINGIRGTSSTARTAGQTVANAIVQGINAGKSALNSAVNSLKSTLTSGISGISSLASTARSHGTNISAGVAAGINSGAGNVRSAANGIVNAARQPLASLGGQSQNWGYELGRNFATGIANSRPSAIDEARRTALAVSAYLKHSTPKLGPLHDDNVWGYHLGQNFAQGMARALPIVEAASAQMASAAVLPVVDTGVLSGAYAAADNALTSEAIFDAFSAAMDKLDIGVTIGSREFGRILREYGAIA